MSFGTPPAQYRQADEAQFRAAVERRLVGISDPPTAAPVLVESPTLSAGDNDDYDLGDDVVQLRVTSNAAGSNLTGVTGGTETRKLRIVNLGSGDLTIVHQDTGSTAENRIITPDGLNWVLETDDVVDLEYDAVTDRWRLVELTPVTVTLPPRLTDLTLTVFDDGTDDDYSVSWEVSAEVTDAYSLELVAVKNGIYITTATEGSPASTTTWSYTAVGGGDGIVDTHMLVANLRDSDGDVIDSKTVVVLSGI